jgi:two-component system chemotaxis sensor kinase CheA
MPNPFLVRYHDGNLLTKTNALNLFWVLALMVASGLAILLLSILGPGISGGLVPPILFGFVAFSLVALLLLTIGQLQAASWLTFTGLLAAVFAVSVFSRSGSLEMDFFQATVLFFLGLLVLSAIGVGGRLTAVWVVAGFGALAAIWFFPDPDENLNLTIAQWNREFNPLVITTLYAVGSLAGTLLLIQGRRNLKMMQWDQEIIQANNEMLEQTVVDRTRALKTILDSSGQGLFTFGEDFAVESDYSAGCQTIFGKEIGGLEADKLLFPQSDLAREFRQGLALYFAGKSKASVIFDLLEKETFVRSRFLTIGYREAGPGKILVVLTDVTLDRQLADRNRADEARRTLVMKALGHKRFFAGLLSEAETLFETLRVYEERPATAEESQALLASIHTFKGNCGFFGFTSTQDVAHDFEYAISDAQVLGEELDYHDLGLDLKRSYYQELGVITDIMGKEWLEEAGGIVIPREVYDKVAKFVGKKFSDETHLVDVLEHFRKMPLRDLFSRFPFVAQATAERLGKRIAPLQINGGEIRVVPERLETLVSVCVHIVNNMVDHGIELSYVREGLGKPPEGRITLDLIRENSSVVIRFSDDGHGVSFPEVEARAKRLGLLAADATPDHRQLLQILFEPGFSTRDEATEVSGRGIGLAAVRAEAERLGGRVEAHSKAGAGTTFEILIPIGVFANRRARGPAPGPERRKV